MRVDGVRSPPTAAVTLGQHFVSVAADGYERWAAVVPVAGAQTRFKPPIHLHRPPPVDRLVALAGRPEPQRLLVGALERSPNGWTFTVRDITLADGRIGERFGRARRRPDKAPRSPAWSIASTRPSPSEAPRWRPWVLGACAAVLVPAAIAFAAVAGEASPNVSREPGTMAMRARRSLAKRACVLALLAPAFAGCGDDPELVLQIRVPADDQGLFKAVTQLNLTASRDDVVLAQQSFSASTSSVSLVGVSHGPRTILTLEGVDGSKQVIAFGQTCPLDFEGPNTTEPLYFAPTSFFAPTADTPAARYHPVGAALSDGAVLLVGGNDREGAALSTVELFVPGAATFSAAARTTTSRERAPSRPGCPTSAC